MGQKDSPAETQTTTWTGPTAERFESCLTVAPYRKQNSEYFDPCQEAASKSIRCLHRNGGDREMCGDFFQAYRDCKEQWVRTLTLLSSHRAI
ncbi:hypothetical protein BCR34DRAFT_497992 [Clohesyomyces aquaticus]|uniref:Cysteine alpha-hairpin motif superfamily n=1 Tax=Clohesyomyces aquaticus TaxID=1231657 RepID=A0A1Y1YDE6_9PLEO|nr:hypothetical protein BCR34DRAFT_497992 [Clohesyomyces aquaticus]